MNRIKELRQAKGFKTQKDLANHLYVNQTAVSQWERGVTMPSSQMLLRLSEIFGVSVDYLLGNVNEPFFILDNERILKDINGVETGEIEKKPTPGEGGGPTLDARLVDRLMQLTPEEQEKVEAFVQGMIAERGTK